MSCPKCGQDGFISKMKIVEINKEVNQCGNCQTCWTKDNQSVSQIFDNFPSFLGHYGHEYGYVEIEGIRMVCQMCNGNGEIDTIKVLSLGINLSVCDICNACWLPDEPITRHTLQTLPMFLKENNLDTKDTIKIGKRMLCPACDGQGEIHKVKIFALDIELNLCDECEAYWTNEQHITSNMPNRLFTLLEKHGLDYHTAQIERL